MRVLVCGGRDYLAAAYLGTQLDRLHAEQPFSMVIHGGSTGADRIAGEWAALRKVPVQVYFAKWGALGRRAGPMRNAQMLSDGKPDLVVAFAGGTGTNDMVSRALRAGVRVVDLRTA